MCSIFEMCVCVTIEWAIVVGSRRMDVTSAIGLGATIVIRFNEYCRCLYDSDAFYSCICVASLVFSSSSSFACLLKVFIVLLRTRTMLIQLKCFCFPTEKRMQSIVIAFRLSILLLLLTDSKNNAVHTKRMHSKTAALKICDETT